MRKYTLVAMMVLAVAGFAAAQIQSITTDVLGAHLNYGRGCAACHAPHSGAYGNGAAKTADTTAGNSILWGQDVGSLFSQTIDTGGVAGGRTPYYIEVLPANMNAGTPDVNGLLTCLSCHDGNWAKGAMMKNAVYESLPGTYGGYNTIPTLLGNNGYGQIGDYLNDHPVGLNAVVSCGGQWNWDCSEVNGVIYMNGTNSSQFVTNYGFFVSPSAYLNNPVVVCTTCHNQHLMNVVKVPGSSGSGLPAGNYATMFFLVGPYNPWDQDPGSNQTAQFCRQCHGGESNEMNGSTAVTNF